MLTYILRASSRLCLAALILASAPLHCAIAQPQTAPSSQSAPPSQFASVADEVAATLTRAKAKRVVVFDFVYPYSAEWDRVGEQLAADFRHSLDATPHKFTQVDRDEILTWMKRDSIDQNQFAFSSVGIYASRDAQVDGWVFVELQPDDSRVKLTFNVYTGKKGGASKSFAAVIPRTPELNALVDHSPPSSDPLASYPASMSHGITMPNCSYCPAAEYSEPARKARIQGLVQLEVVVGTNGAADHFVVKRGLPLGLTDRAIAAVKKWRFEPARDANGDPVAVRQTIEVNFQLY